MNRLTLCSEVKLMGNKIQTVTSCFIYIFDGIKHLKLSHNQYFTHLHISTDILKGFRL